MRFSLNPILAGLFLSGVLSGCQTTNTGFDKTREVDIRETRIVMPEELSQIKGFEIERAVVRESGSYRRETVYFTGGFFYLDRYFRGGMLNVNEDRFRQRIAKMFPDAPLSNIVSKANIAIGDVYYATLMVKGETCFIMSGNYGQHIQLRGGAGSEGSTVGIYCEKGDVPNLKEAVFRWMKRVRLR